MMILIQKTLLHSPTNRLLLRNGGTKPLVQRLGRPRRQSGVHLGLFLAPGDFEGLVLQEESFCCRAELGYVAL